MDKKQYFELNKLLFEQKTPKSRSLFCFYNKIKFCS